jgi:Putative Flp pilus-assembly TadE/G-like
MTTHTHRDLRSERGQTLVMSLLFMTVLLGMAALVLDIGSWYHAQRALQAKADAAALAGAQALPESTDDATAYAVDYAKKNGGDLKVDDITFSRGITDHDTISVKMSEPADGFFSKLFGLDKVTVGAKAGARSANINAARWAAPIGVDIKHEYLSGSGCPCFGVSTTLDLKKTGPGAFRLLNLDGSRGGTGPGVLADWMEHGFDGFMPVNKGYYSDPGAKFNGSDMQAALDDRIGSEVLFPIYDSVSGTGANLTYHVIGWVGFHLTGYDARGSNGTVSGWFTRVVWEGIEVETGGDPDFGVRAVQLVN